MKKFLIIFAFIFSTSLANAIQRVHQEKYYQNLWAKQHNAITEYILPDKTRVDCVTQTYAVEVDFANKWAESIGQSLYYAKCLNKKPAVVLIMEDYQKDMKYLKRLQKVALDHGITIFTISP